MPVVRIPYNQIADWDTFHSVFAQVLGFPSFYGKNMNAWVDCLTYLEEPGDGMSNIVLHDHDIISLHQLAKNRGWDASDHRALLL